MQREYLLYLLIFQHRIKKIDGIIYEVFERDIKKKSAIALYRIVQCCIDMSPEK